MLTLTQSQIREIEHEIRQFIWNHKHPEVALETLCGLKEQGGLHLVNLEAKQDCIKISWIFKLNKQPLLRTCAYQTLSPVLQERIWQCNIIGKDVSLIFKENIDNFWVQMLISWCKINFRTSVPDDEIAYEILWFNSHIKINCKPILWLKWFRQNIIYVQGLVDEVNGTWKSHNQLNTNWLEWRQLISSLPHDWKPVNIVSVEPAVNRLDKYTKLTEVGSSCRNRRIYNILLSNNDLVEKYRVRWLPMLDIDKELYMKGFKLLYQCTSISKFRDFQYHLLLGKIITNLNLKEWKLLDSDQCNFCHEAQEDIIHLLFNCCYVEPLWLYLTELCQSNNIQSEFNVTNILLSMVSAVPIINFLTIMVKQYTYRK